MFSSSVPSSKNDQIFNSINSFRLKKFSSKINEFLQTYRRAPPFSDNNSSIFPIVVRTNFIKSVGFPLLFSLSLASFYNTPVSRTNNTANTISLTLFVCVIKKNKVKKRYLPWKSIRFRALIVLSTRK